MSRIKTAVLAWVLCMSPAWAGKIAQFSPQGTVATIESVKLVFDTDVVAFGDGQAPAPIDVACNDPHLEGKGRWLDARRWTYVFTQAPGPGVSCTAKVRADFRTLTNEALVGKSSFTFQTGGPVLKDSRPYGSTIDEDQVFILRFNGEVNPDSLLANTHCLVEGLGEAVPMRLISGEQRKAILKAAYFWQESGVDTAATQLLQCKRRLPAEARVQLKVGPGVATPAGSRPAVANTKAALMKYTVRTAFKAEFSCQRENSSMPCTPVSSFSVALSAPVARADAVKARLRLAEQEWVPTINSDDTHDGGVSVLRFQGPFPEQASFTLSLPDGLKDDAGRLLVNANQFPLTVKTAAFPPLVKFAAAPFGVVERFANVSVGGDAQAPASVPLTLRNVEAALATRELAVSAGKISDYSPQNDQDVLRWFARVQRLNDNYWTANQVQDIMADRQPRSENLPHIDVRGFSMLKGLAGTTELVLPGIDADGPRPFEVIGVPLARSGLHILEVESARLGLSLLESAAPMYVRTAALVTNLGVHVKTGRDDALAWVTTLDDGRVVPDAAVAVLSCSGKLLAQGRTNAQGVWHHPQALDAPDYCEDTGLSGIYVSARIPADHAQARGMADFSFVFSGWNRGIESWRFNVPTDNSPQPTVVAHTVFDRSLLRAGETVSMKHFVRTQTRDGYALPTGTEAPPDKLLIDHQGSDQRYEQPLSWKKTATGGLSAVSTFSIPETARLGVYTVQLTDADGRWYGSSEFRVEEFKLPLLTGQLKVSDETGADTLIAPTALSADVQISYVSGGPAGQLPLRVSGVLKDRALNFPEYDDYSFRAPDKTDTERDDGGSDSGTEKQRLFLDKQAAVLDAQGGARLAIASVPPVRSAQTLLLEASFADPNGQVQTLAQSVPVWPAAVQAGIRAGSWVRAGKPLRISGLALAPSGTPQPDAAIEIKAVARTTYSTRKRMVGGFYSYDNRTEIRQLGTLCEGKTDAKGMLECSVELQGPGAIELIATVKDSQGRESRALSTTWVTGAGDLWFGGENDDRIDIIPAKKTWKPGEVAQFQVRMPFRRATALVAIEREGILKTQVVELAGDDPTIRIPIEAQWGPNVYVSVLALRGRVREVPWYSFFTWGWQQPKAWYGAFVEGAEGSVQPTAFVDLAKPSFRFGLAEIFVSDEQDQLRVKVSADKSTYQLRDKAVVSLEVTTPDGKPAAHGTVAFAAVDQALLELAPNDSWDLLSAMRQMRSYGVETATAQMEIVGRRHYGRKALPAGGGGGKSPTRELLDTLLLWQPEVQLDANGKAQLTVPLNDAITRFRLVAVADYGVGRFGTGSSSIASTKDLQIISGLPALIREGDRYQATITVRNSTQRDMRLDVSAAYTGHGVPGASLAAQAVSLAPGTAQTVSWDIEAPEGNAWGEKAALAWTLDAREQGVSAASDTLLFQQVLMSAVPVRTRQATLLALDAGQPPASLPVSAPKGALVNANGEPRGGLLVHVQSSLAGGLPGVREWFGNYPYTCLEQVASKAIGLRSQSQWQDLMHKLPDYLDGDGLASYFPGAYQGNEVLTAYLLAVSHEAQVLGLPYAIPDATRQTMTRGLLAFAQGKLVRNRWAPRKDLDARKLVALEALSRYGLVQPRMLDSIAIDPDRWPTSAVIDWMAVLQRVPAIPQQGQLLARARQIILARLLDRGTTMAFGGEARDDWWWLMVGPESNLAKLILTTADQAQWQQELPRLAQGLLSLQRQGAWRTTTANLLGTLAITRFSRQFEREPVSGSVWLSLLSQGSQQTADWSAMPSTAGVSAHDFLQAWPKATGDVLLIGQEGQGQSWATVSSMAAVPVTSPVVAGYEIQRSIKPVSQSIPGVWSRGDVYRVTLNISAKSASTWVVVTDPVPAGASILGSGLGRDSGIATQTEAAAGWYGPSFIERSFESYRAYYEYLPAGASTLEYTVRLNTVGQFQLPPTRMEAMYQPDVFGELPNTEGFTVRAD